MLKNRIDPAHDGELPPGLSKECQGIRKRRTGKAREPQKAAAPNDLQPMATAPRDGKRVRLWLRDGGDFVGYYTDRW